MRAVAYGAKAGAILALAPGVAVALFLYVLGFGFADRSLIRTPVFFTVVTGALVAFGAALGAAVGGLIDLLRMHRAKSGKA